MRQPGINLLAIKQIVEAIRDPHASGYTVWGIPPSVKSRLISILKQVRRDNECCAI